MADAATISNPSVLSNPQTLAQWNSLLESLFGTPATNTNSSGSTTSTTTSSSDATDPIKAILALLIPGATGGVNNPQSQALIQNLLTQFKEGAGGLSGIQAAGNSAGVYNSSTQGLLANDAMSRAIAQAAQGIGNQQNQQQQVIANLLNTLMQSTKATNQAGTTASQQSQSRGGSLGSNAGKALGGAAAAALAKKALDGLGTSNAALTKDMTEEEKALADRTSTAGADDESVNAAFGSLTGGGDSPTYSNQSGDGLDFGGWDSGNSLDNFDFGSVWDSADMSNPGDPFGIGGYDIGSFTSNDSASANFDFVDTGGANWAGGDGGGLWDSPSDPSFGGEDSVA